MVDNLQLEKDIYIFISSSYHRRIIARSQKKSKIHLQLFVFIINIFKPIIQHNFVVNVSVLAYENYLLLIRGSYIIKTDNFLMIVWKL